MIFISPDKDLREVPASVLAYIGDAVFELHVRQDVAARYFSKSGALHKRVISHVRAKAQADAARVLLSELSDAENDIFRRGKNSNPGSMAKNCSPVDYKYATGLEAVIGYLYLSGDHERLDVLLVRILEVQTLIDKGEIHVHGSKETQGIQGGRETDRE